MNEEQYYSIKDVAKMLKVVYLTVYRWIQSGQLVAFKVGKQYRIKENDLNRYIKSYKK